MGGGRRVEAQGIRVGPSTHSGGSGGGGGQPVAGRVLTETGT